MLPLIIEPDQLHGIIAQRNLLIVDLCSEQSYREGHIAGAVSVLPAETIAGIAPAVGKLPTLEQLQKLFNRIGLSPETHVVVYDDEGGGWAGRMIWLLDVIGHSSYSYLNGGLLAWKAFGGELQTELPTPISSEAVIKLHDQYSASREEILAQLEAPNLVVWDARSPAEFRGEKVFAKKGGHIPGAINCEWTQLMDGNRQLRIRTDAREFLASQGLDASKRIVTHCQTHHRSGFTYLVGKMLGFNIRAYDGSWGEWGNHPDTPVEQ